MSDRSRLYFLSDLEQSANQVLSSAAQSVIPCVNRSLISKASGMTVEWRYPFYKEFFKRDDLFLDLGAAQSGNRLFARFRNLLARPFRRLTEASYIEWRYYSILSKQFHGIVGAALFNPEGRLLDVAESGLLLIVAGVVDGVEAAQRGPASVSDICWMKLFPTKTLQFSEADPGFVRAEHDGVFLEIMQKDVGAGYVKLSGNDAPAVSLELSSVPGTSMPPVLGEDLRLLPGSHWIVHNTAPMATVKGTLRVPSRVLSRMPPDGGRGAHPNYVSSVLKAEYVHNDFALAFEGAGYYEHSFGICPMPQFGWDFFFAPDPVRGSSLVMQTYRRSRELRYLEAFWREGDEQRYQRFEVDDLEIEWCESFVHPNIGSRVPTHRRVRAKKNGLVLEAENRVLYQIPFLRPEAFFVRHFFISEEVGLTSWRLMNESGQILFEARDIPSGGETARLRFRA